MKLYVSGGVNHGGGFALEAQVMRSVEVFDPATGTWASKASTIFNHVDHGLLAVPNDKLFAVGGDAEQSAECYDPQTDSWTHVPEMDMLGHGHWSKASVTFVSGRL